MKFNRILSICAGLLCLGACSSNMEVKSPDGEIAVKVEFNDSGVALYQVRAYGQDVFGVSELGLEAEEANLHEGFAVDMKPEEALTVTLRMICR